MKVYILRGAASSYVFEEVMETDEFYLARLKDGGFDIFAKAAFTLTVAEAWVPGARPPSAIGFGRE